MSKYDRESTPVVFDGTHCPICNTAVDVEVLDDGRTKFTCNGPDHNFGRIAP